MKTTDFIKRHCVRETCPNFDYCDGCHAYGGEECGAAFSHPIWRGLSMVDRINMFCEKKRKEVQSDL